jgi:hypothetical protein
MSDPSMQHLLFAVTHCDSEEHDQLIKELAEIHSEFAIAVALPYFGVDWDYITIPKDLNIEWNVIKSLFDKYCTSYHIIMDGQVWQK